MASQKKQTFDKNAATRTKYVNQNVANNVVHNQWVGRHDPSTLNTAIWAQTTNPGDQSIGSVGMNKMVHDFIVDESPDNTSSRMAQVSGVTNGEGGSNPESNRAAFDKSVAAAAATVAEEKKSEKTRTSTHADAMASQKKQTFDKNAATRTKYVNQNVANNVVHNQWVGRHDPSTLNTAIWSQTSAPGDRTINP